MAAPNLTVQIQGQGAVGADNFNTFEQTCDNFSQLKAFVGIAGIQVFARGMNAPGDGFQGDFYWSSNSTSVDDNGVTTLTPYGSSSTTPGRWLRLPPKSAPQAANTLLANDTGLAAPPAAVPVDPGIWAPLDKAPNTNGGFATWPATALVAAGSYAGSFSDGVVVDYSTGFGRVSVGSGDAINFYNGGVGNTRLAQFTSGGALLLTQGIVGVVTGGDAVAGQVGEYISSSVASGGAQSLTTGANPVDVTSVSLTAGDWDCEGNIAFLITASTSITQLYGWISRASATLPTFPNAGGLAAHTSAATVPGQVNGPILAISRFRVSISAPTTVYLSAQATFTASTNAAYGFLGCRRVR